MVNNKHRKVTIQVSKMFHFNRGIKRRSRQNPIQFIVVVGQSGNEEEEKSGKKY